MSPLQHMLLSLRLAIARLPSILNLKLVHKGGDLKVLLLHNHGKFSDGTSHFSNLFINGSSLCHHGRHEYCTR